MIKVCDAIMGTGKSSAAITYLNEHSDQKFIYITPYLEEAARIKEGCPKLHFVEPSNAIKKFNFKKSLHTMALIKEGKNISTTHQAFKGYTSDTLEYIKEQGYTLIIDENVDILEKYDVPPVDINVLVRAGYIEERDGEFAIIDDSYDGRAHADTFHILKSRKLIRLPDESGNASWFYWALPPELITSFKDVFILTYLFEGQSIHHFLKIYNIDYEMIGIDRDENGTFRFGSYPGYVPDYVTRLDKMLHIVDNERLNEIGDGYHALSMSWFKKGSSDVDRLKHNVYNFFNNVHRDSPHNKKLWGVYLSDVTKIRGKGYTNSFLTFNAKATNQYRDRDCLVYIANIFMNVNEKKFYYGHGINVDEDMYALSIMVQWIWRSAIRDGQEVSIYVPSKRMRKLLQNWIKETMAAGVTTATETTGQEVA